MIPRLDDNGKPSTIKNQPNETRQQRVTQESYSEYYITDKEEVKSFIQKFAVNHEEFDYEKSLNMATMEDATKVATGPKLILEK
jgi:NurA-like 5'-3' nuclease